MSNNPQSQTNNTDEIDLGKLLGVLLDNRWLIISITAIFAVFGIIYALLATPIYKADALIQVESKSSGMSALVGDMGSLVEQDSSANTEVQIITSRMVIGRTVDNLDLTTVAVPKYIPYIGKGLARITGTKLYIDISRFEVLKQAESSILLVVDNSAAGSYSIYDNQGLKLFTGKVGALAENKDYRLFVSDLAASDGDEFLLSKRSKLAATQYLQAGLSISDRAKTGVLELTFTGENKAEIESILDDISQNYFLQNVDRNSAEVAKSLDFLNSHLPKIKNDLNNSEDVLNDFLKNNDAIDLGLEAQSTLKLMIDLEAQLNDLTFEESELNQRFTSDHPTYKALLDKRKLLLARKDILNKQVQNLPETQRDILRIKRNVEVNQQIYIQLLNKVQELNILKAGTVGNVRILDNAQAYSTAIKPKKSLIVVMATLLGAMLALSGVLIRSVLHRGVENPDEIEALGLPVYASIPMSDWQAGMDVKVKHNKHKKNFELHETLLAESNPADLSIEALRGLRTSMHFAMMEAKNNVVMISGPAPGIGKSFVSANFAAVIAKTGQKVLLVDGDMRKGYLQRHFNLDWDSGLSEMLSGKLDTKDVIKSTAIENLDVITRGQIPPNPSELLMHPRFSDFVEWASSEYDLVLIDTPPVLAVTDPSIVGALVGTTLMVGRFGQNTVKEIEVARHRFEMAGIEVKGFILNAVEKKASASYGYGYYNYSYESDKS